VSRRLDSYISFLIAILIKNFRVRIFSFGYDIIMASMKTMLVSVFDVGVTMNENLRSGTTSKRRMIAAFLSRHFHKSL